VKIRKAVSSFNLLDVSRLPALVDGGFGRAVEPEDSEITSAGHSGEPVAFFACGCFGPEIEVHATVGVAPLHQFDGLTQFFFGLSLVTLFLEEFGVKGVIPRQITGHPLCEHGQLLPRR
jgi:hypothetical protein